MSEENPTTYFAQSKDGRSTEVNVRNVPPATLEGYLSSLVTTPTSGFRLRIRDRGEETVVSDYEIYSDSDDPEGDLLFLEHIVYDEACGAESCTVETVGTLERLG